jgi:antitoxin component YwqK of YwqJK toxin-antitoxin module
MKSLLRGLRHLTGVAMALILMSADRHSQTSVDSKSQQIIITLNEEQILVYIDGPGVYFEKSLQGQLTFLKFFRLNKLVKVWFHPSGGLGSEEQPRLVQRLKLVEGKWLSDGLMEVLDPYGRTLCETNWVAGRLNGAQRTYSEEEILLEERFFEDAFPIGSWKLFYHDGTLASEVAFPKDKAQWLSTFVRGSTGRGKSLVSMDYHNPVVLKEAWYSTSGRKQKEQELSCFYDGKSYRVEETGVASYHDEHGRLIRQLNLRDGSGRDNHDFTMLGVRYRRSGHWSGSRLFKDEIVEEASQPPKSKNEG